MVKLDVAIKFNNEIYDEIHPDAVAATKALVDMYNILGKPKDPLSEAGQKLMKVVISVWHDLYPLEAKSWLEARKEHLNAEMSISEQVAKRTGRSLASYPLPVYQLMKGLFPMFDPGERENCIKMIQVYPIFRMVNKL